MGSIGVVSKYCNFVTTFIKDHVLALGPLLLSTLYRGIFHLFSNLEDGHIEYTTIFGLIWFLILLGTTIIC